MSIHTAAQMTMMQEVTFHRHPKARMMDARRNIVEKLILFILLLLPIVVRFL